MYDPNAPTNVLRLENVKESVINGFIEGDLEFAFDYSALVIECIGGDDFLVTSEGIQWPDVPIEEPTEGPTEEATSESTEAPTEEAT